MVLLKSHKVLLAISVIGLFLSIVVFLSPGWFRLHYYKHEPTPGIFGKDVVLTNDEPVAMAKRSADAKHGKHHHGHHHDHHHGGHHEDEKMVPGAKKVHISCGLWYFSACVCGMNLDGKRIDKCHFSSYCQAKKNAYNLPTELQGAGLEFVYTNIGGNYNKGL